MFLLCSAQECELSLFGSTSREFIAATNAQCITAKSVLFAWEWAASKDPPLTWR